MYIMIMVKPGTLILRYNFKLVIYIHHIVAY